MRIKHRLGYIEYDPQDNVLVRDTRWYKNAKGCLFRRRVENMTEVHTEYLHSLIVNALPSERVSFADGNPLNVQRSNLIKGQFTGNRGTGVIQGVYYDKSNGRYRAVVVIDGKRKTVGYYRSEEEAISARNAKLASMEKGDEPRD